MGTSDMKENTFNKTYDKPKAKSYSLDKQCEQHDKATKKQVRREIEERLVAKSLNIDFFEW